MALTAIVISSGGCSGGGKSAADGGDPSADRSGKAAAAAAATTTAETNVNCIAVAPFYWEIGDTSGTLVSGSVGAGAPVASTVMSILSASKWLFGAYAIQKMGGIPAEMYVPFLNLTSGYAGFTANSCPPLGTIDDCLADAAGTQIAADVGKFAYDGAHLQKLASLMGLGADDNAALATEVKSQIGSEINFEYTQPQPAGGIDMSAEQYALFLRKLLVGSPTPLRIASILGSDAVCTNPTTCPSAVFSPIPSSASPAESWHYGLAHWIEDDAAVGDGAFSSAGGFGFYPWIDATRTIYGVLARQAPFTGHAGYDSVLCGRSIRKAWVTGVASDGGGVADAAATDGGGDGTTICTGIVPTGPTIDDFTPDAGTGVPTGAPFFFAQSGLAKPVLDATVTTAMHITFDTGTPTMTYPFVGWGVPFIDCVDASAYSGIKFTISGTLSAGCTLQFSAQFSEDELATANPRTNSCVPLPGRSCYPPAYVFSTATPLTTTPTDVTVSFAQQSGGAPVTVVDRARLSAFQWQLNPPAGVDGSGGGCIGDVTIDDVVFVP